VAQIESLLAGNFVVHLLEDKLRKSKRPPTEMSVAEVVQFFRDTMDLLENRLTAQEYGAKYGIQ
jgi:hypothetical protein